MNRTRNRDFIPAAVIAILLIFTMTLLPFTAYAATSTRNGASEYTNLGTAQGYNLVCFDSFQNGSTDIRGKTFIGNDISVQGGFTFGVHQADTSAEVLTSTSDYALIFGAKDSGSFHVGSGGSQYKALVYNDAVKSEVQPVFSGSVDLWKSESNLLKKTGLDLSDSDTELNGNTVTEFQKEMMTLSEQIAGLTASGNVYVTSWGALALKGTHSDVNIFSMDGDNVAGSGRALSDMIEMHIDVPTGSTVIINVTGTDVGFPGGSTFSSKIETNPDGSFGNIGNPRTNISQSMTQRRVLWNYSEAETVTLKGSVSGSILAPSALLQFSGWGGNFEGTLVVNSLKTDGKTFEGHNYPFNGKIPVSSEDPSSSQSGSSSDSSSSQSSSSDSSSSQSSSSDSSSSQSSSSDSSSSQSSSSDSSSSQSSSSDSSSSQSSSSDSSSSQSSSSNSSSSQSSSSNSSSSQSSSSNSSSSQSSSSNSSSSQSSSSNSSSSQSSSPDSSSSQSSSSSFSSSSKSSGGGNHGGGGHDNPVPMSSPPSSGLEVISDESTPLTAPSDASLASVSSASYSGPEQIANDPVPLSSPKTGESRAAALVFSVISIASLGTALLLNHNARRKK